MWKLKWLCFHSGYSRLTGDAGGHRVTHSIRTPIIATSKYEIFQFQSKPEIEGGADDETRPGFEMPVGKSTGHNHHVTVS